MNEKSPKVSVSPEDLNPLGAMMVTAHPDSQSILHRPKTAAYEDIPRSIEAVEALSFGEPFDTFSRGAGSIYLSESAAGSDTLAGLDKTRRLGAEGQALGTWANTQAVPVRKPFGGFSFGTRAPKGASAQADVAAAPPERSGAPASVSGDRVESQALPVDGDRPAPAAEPAVAGEEERPAIGFLQAERPGEPSAIAQPPTGGGHEAETAPGAQSSRFGGGPAGKKASAPPMVTLPVGSRAKAPVPRPTRPPEGGHSVLPRLGPLGGLLWLAAGALSLALWATGPWPRPEQPRTPGEYLGWEEGQLEAELHGREALHVQRLADPRSSGHLVELQREERELAVLTEVLGRLRERRR